MRGIYIHIPFCAKRCVYCSFVSGMPHDRMRPYIAALKREMEERLYGDEISTIYIGGGTPSVLYRGAISDLLSFIRGRCKVAKNAEITVECNPDSVSEDFAEEIFNAGVNRVSIGLQTDNDKLLKALNRPHNKEDFLRAWKLLDNIKNKSLDLMLGLPGQKEEDLMSSLSLAVSLNAPHISLYALKVEEGTPLYESGYIADDDFEADLYDKAYKFLVNHGYRRYEVSNFCKDDMYSRHNFSYWDMTEYYGFGISAHSYLNGKRIANDDNIDKYILGKGERFVEDGDWAEEYIMLSLRTDIGIDLKRLSRHGMDLLSEKRKIISDYIRDGFLIKEGDFLRLSDNAFYIMNDIICNLI